MKKTKRQFSAETLELVARTLKAISHPVKLEILEVLEDEEPLDVSTIHQRLSMHCEVSMMSHHLIKMRDNGILLSTKVGKQVYYRIADRTVLNVFDCMNKCIKR